MHDNDPVNLTLILSKASGGDAAAASALMPLVYDELRRLAAAYFRRQDHGQTLQPTALVHEAYMKLIDSTATWTDRAHFFAVAATAMRHILIDHARRRRSMKRGGDREQFSIATIDGAISGPGLDVLELHDAMERLAAHHDRKARVVEMRVFGGLTCPEVAQALDVSLRTVESDWYAARAWLRRELAGGAAGSSNA